jgi:two-component system chemotaxis response regulator CheB
MNQVRVLVVDDSVTIRAMMRQVLESDPGIRITGMAASAEEAEAMMEGCIPHVITLDIEMPGKGGLAFLEEVLKTHKTPVIMLSSHAARGDDTRIKALMSGAVGCFNKANVIRDKARLIRLVKDAARHRARLDPEDKAAVQMMKDAACQVEQLATG